MAKTDTIRDLTALSVVQVAELLGVTDKSVRNWMNKNGLQSFESAKGRMLDWHMTLKWFVAYRVSELGNDGKAVKNSASIPADDDSESYDDALARKTRAEANLKELQLAKERGQVASITDVERAISISNKATQTQVLAVPSRLATRLLGIEDRGRMTTILEGEMRQLLTNLATIDAVREASGASAEGE